MEEEYRKAVCGKTARTVDEGAVGNTTALLNRGKDRGVAESPYLRLILYIDSRGK